MGFEGGPGASKAPRKLKTSLKWLTVAMPLLETSERLIRERLERDGAMADGLTQTNEIE